MAEIGSATLLPSTPASSRRGPSAQESIEERQALADLQRLVEEQRKQDRNQRDIARADDRRALVDGLRADEFGESQSQRVIRDEFRDRQLIARQQAADAADDIDLRRRLDRREADVRELADRRQDGFAADRAIEDRERRLIEARRLEDEAVRDGRFANRPEPEDDPNRISDRRLDERQAFLRAEDERRLAAAETTLADLRRAATRAAESQALATRAFEETVFSAEPAVPGVQVLAPAPVERPETAAPASVFSDERPQGTFAAREAAPVAPEAAPARSASALEARDDSRRIAFEAETERRRLERRIADFDIERRQRIDLELSERRLTTVGFDPRLPRGSIVNVIG